MPWICTKPRETVGAFFCSSPIKISLLFSITTDGNLSVHMRILETAEYITCDKDFQARKPQTIYRITVKGRD
ncbi:MAG: hypothetical protein HGA70_04960, partial [Chlorobiaceae bacterium]|nr:hypothetical protein [Chlorobiaceae bacterium]